jgi:hypothetical protein
VRMRPLLLPGTCVVAPHAAHVATARAARGSRPQQHVAGHPRPPVAGSRMRQETRRRRSYAAAAHIVRNKVPAFERRRARLREAGPL